MDTEIPSSRQEEGERPMEELRIFVFEDSLFLWGAVVIARSEDEAREMLAARNIRPGPELYNYPLSMGVIGEWGGNG